MKDGSFLAQGYAPTKHTREDDCEDATSEHHGVPPGTAERSRICRLAARAARSKAPAP